MDETAVVHKCKNHRGRAPPQTKWLVGIVDSFHKPARGILLQVPDRTAPTMDQFITNHVLRGSTIHSDMWRSYNKLADLGYVHHTVNHSTHFVDALTGVHTQKIESSWNKLKL